MKAVLDTFINTYRGIQLYLHLVANQMNVSLNLLTFTVSVPLSLERESTFSLASKSGSSKH